jgi:hypothetical protein
MTITIAPGHFGREFKLRPGAASDWTNLSSGRVHWKPASNSQFGLYIEKADISCYSTMNLIFI